MVGSPRIEGLRDYDIQVLKVLGEHAVAGRYHSDYILETDIAMRLQPLALTSKQIRESLSLFATEGLAKEYSHNFQLTARGFEIYLKAFYPPFSNASSDVQRLIVFDGLKVDKDIAAETSVPISGTRFLMQRLKSARLLDLSESSDGYQVYNVTPRLERNVRDEQERENHIRIEPLRLFYSYSHKDESLRDELQNHLSTLKRLGTISEWHDRKIPAGSAWKGEIDENLTSADVVLLLVSSDFLASDYCFDVETKKALERHEAGDLLLIPVVLRPCDWKDTPIGQLQALPKNACPVTKWENRDEAFLDIVEGIKRSIQVWRERLGQC